MLVQSRLCGRASSMNHVLTGGIMMWCLSDVVLMCLHSGAVCQSGSSRQLNAQTRWAARQRHTFKKGVIAAVLCSWRCDLG